MSQDLPRPRRIWLRPFYEFDPDVAAYIGWTEESHRNRMLKNIESGDLFLIYGTSSSQTSQHDRKKVLGFLQVQANAVRDIDQMSLATMEKKKSSGEQGKWTYAIPVIRAWRADQKMSIERVAPESYSPNLGRAINVWGKYLNPEEMENAFRIKVTEVQVYNGPELDISSLKHQPLEQVFRPSRAFPGSFGERTAVYEDGPTYLYLARFEGDGHALIGKSKPLFDKAVLLKIGVSNDKSRRETELNSGFPPASLGKWTMALISRAYDGRLAAESAEQAFKDRAEKQLTSLGGEFFIGDWTAAQIIFAAIPGIR